MSLTEKFLSNYKPLIAVPVIITMIMIGILAVHGVTENIDLKGGSTAAIQLQKNISSNDLKTLISNGIGNNQVQITSLANNQATIEISGPTNVNTFNNAISGTATILSFQSVGALLSTEALQEIYYALAFAFIFMSITVFIVFRNIVPSLAVIFAALSDIIIALGGMSIFGIPLSVASVGALLMLIGYSVDTDILLTTRVLKRREGTINERAIDAMKTGLTMAAAAIGSMVALYLVVVIFIPYAETLSLIASVLIIGLTADIAATWLMNLGILRVYMERRR